MTEIKKENKSMSNVPNLRFPEFKGEWEVKKLGEVATNKSVKYNPINATSSIRCIELEHLASQTGELLGYIDGSKSGSIKNVFNEGDVLFGKLRPYLKKHLQAPFDGVCSSEIWVLKGTNISNDFLYRIIQTNSFIDLANQSSGSKMPRADWNVVENGLFSIPSLLEQQKIASFLSLIDERISTQSKIILRLESLIQNLRDKIFKQNLRFKTNKELDFPNWENKSLGEICEKKSSSISANKIEDNFGEYIIYGASGVLKKVDFYEEKSDYISIVKDGSGVGRLFYCKGKSSVLGTMDIIKPLANTNTYFLFYLLSNIDFTKFVTGSTIPHIYFKDYKNENFGIPSIEEQTKIAVFLSQIDDKIEIEKQLLIQYENQKNYLLQNLFI